MTLLAAAAVTVVITATVALVLVSIGVATKVRAQTAADAAALSAVVAGFTGDDPLEAATEIAAHNGAVVVECVCPVDRSAAIRSAVVQVAVEVPGTRWHARARAGAEFDPVAAVLGPVLETAPSP